MPVLNTQTPTVQVSIPVPTPAAPAHPSTRKPPPAAPQPAPQPAASVPQQPMMATAPLMPTAFIMPWTPEPKQQKAVMRRRLPVRVVKYATSVGKHGTPQWNPKPHFANGPEAVAARDSDPLWLAHRGHPLDANGNLGRGIAPYTVALHEQIQHHTTEPDRSIPLPSGMVVSADAVDQANNDDTDIELTRRVPRRGHDPHGALSPNHPDNTGDYNRLWSFHGSSGRRPWYNTVFPLQDLVHFAEPHDPYRLLASSVLSGNRHALPPLVDLLKRRDNPSGWYAGWPILAKAMEERVGDKTPWEAYRRLSGIAKAAAKHSQFSAEHYAIANGIEEYNADMGVLPGHSGADVPVPDLSGYGPLSDHMEENGLPQYAQLMRAELANVFPQYRHETKGRRRLTR